MCVCFGSGASSMHICRFHGASTCAALAVELAQVAFLSFFLSVFCSFSHLQTRPVVFECVTVRNPVFFFFFGLHPKAVVASSVKLQKESEGIGKGWRGTWGLRGGAMGRLWDVSREQPEPSLYQSPQQSQRKLPMKPYEAFMRAGASTPPNLTNSPTPNPSLLPSPDH